MLASRDARTRPLENRLYRAMRVAQDELVNRYVRKIETGTKEYAGGLNLDDDAENIAEIAAVYSAAAMPIIEQSFRSGGGAALTKARVPIVFDQDNMDARRFLGLREQRFATQVAPNAWNELNLKLRRGLARGASIDELADIVRSLPAFAPGRAETIARTEVIGAYNGGLEEGFKQSGVVSAKVWIAALDDRTRDTHAQLHDQQVPLGDKFVSSSGASGPAPGQMGAAAEDINCRCTIEAIVGIEEDQQPAPVPPVQPVPPVVATPAVQQLPVNVIQPQRVADLPGAVKAKYGTYATQVIGVPAQRDPSLNTARRPAVPSAATAPIPYKPAASGYEQSWVDPAKPISGKTGKQFVEELQAKTQPIFAVAAVSDEGKQLLAEIQRIDQRIKELSTGRSTMKPDEVAEWKKLTTIDQPETYRQLVALRNKLLPGWNPLTATEVQRAIIDGLKADDPLQSKDMKIAFGRDMKGKTQAAIDLKNDWLTGIDFALQFFDRNQLNEEQYKRLEFVMENFKLMKSRDGRASASGWDAQINWAGSGMHARAVAAHEMGHIIEWILDAKRVLRSQEMVDRRTANESFQTFMGRQYEYMRPDQFQNPYSGKLYYGALDTQPVVGLGRDRQWNLPARESAEAYGSEVVSMGVQDIFQDAEGLLLKDPDYLAFLYDFFKNRGNAE